MASPSWASNMASGLSLGAGAAPFFMGQPDFQNPADAAMPYLDKVPGAMSPYYQPYMDAGKSAMGTLQNEYGTMINDPSAINAKLGAGYKESPGYQFKLHQALSAGDNAAAAGGMAGSPLHQQANETTANDIASQDFNDYMSRMLGIYQGGIKGDEGLNTMGFNASNDMATNIGNSFNNEARLKYMGTGAENEYNQAQAKSNADMWGNLAGYAGNAAMFL